MTIKPKPEGPAEAALLGWKQVGGWTEETAISAEQTQDLLDRATLLESYVSDKYYGDWYHNTALIVFTAFYSWLVARLGGGIAWLFIVLAFTATVYRTSMRRLRQRVRDDLARESAITKISTDKETLEWLNSFLVKFWAIYEPALCEMVVSQVNPILASSTPAMIEGLSLDTFTLGTKPPRIEFVKSYPKTESDIVVMDWKASFIPNDQDDKTASQLKEKVNPKVVLGIRIGKGAISKKIKVAVEDMMFQGTVNIRMKLITTFPHIKTVDVSFLEPPLFDFSLMPLMGADLTLIPGLDSLIKSIVNDNLGPMMYSPNSFQLNIQEMLAGAGVDSAVGVLAVTVYNAHGLKGSDAIGNTVDPYVEFSINSREKLARTKTISNNKNPAWNETKYILVNNLQETLTMSFFDYNDHRKDKLIGKLNIPLDTLETTPDQENLSGEVQDAGKSRGAVNYKLHWFPVLEGRKLDDGTVEPPPDTRTGILKLWVHQAKDLDATKSIVGQLSPYSDMLVNGNLIHQSKSVKRINNPVWEDNFEFLVTDKNNCNLGVRVKDSRGLATDPVLGTYQIKLPTLIDNLAKGNDWYDLSPMGRVRLSATWKPVALKGGDAMRNYVEPIGALRFHFIKADDVKNLETIGKVDPYMRVFVNGFQRARTIAIDDTLAPVWDEVVYIPVNSPSQRLSLELMDAENVGKDRSLGQFALNSSDFIQADEKGNYLPYVDRKVRTSMFSLANKDPKGTLYYTVSFYPSVRVMNPDEAEDKLKADAEKAQKEADEKAKAEADGKKDDKKDDKEADATTLADSEPAKADEELPIIPLEQLVKSESGVVALTFLDTEVKSANTWIRMLSDAHVNPSFSTPKIQNKTQSIGETGEVTVLELDFSEVTLQLVSKLSKPKGDDIIGICKVPTLSLLKNAYQKPYTLQFKKGDKVTGSLIVRARYFPLLMELDPSESINNMGSLTTEIIKADNVPSADSNGFSDPYCTVILNGEKIYKTDKKKKTLNPVWNEKFTSEILSRTAADLSIEVFDWDMAGDDDFLGKVKIDLAQLEPLKPIQLTLPLQGESGTITLRFLFRPAYVFRRVDSSGVGATFMQGAALPGKVITGAAGVGVNAVGNVAGLGVNAVGGVAGGVADGVGGVFGAVKGGTSKFTGAFRGKKNRDASNPTASPDMSTVNPGNVSPPRPSNAGTGFSSPGGPNDGLSANASNSNYNGSPSVTSNDDNASIMPGIVSGQFIITSASNFPSLHLQFKAYLDKKEIIKTKPVKTGSDGGSVDIEEVGSFKGPSESNLIIKAYDHKSLGRSSDIGEVTIPLNTLEPSKPTPITIGSGQIVIQINVRS